MSIVSSVLGFFTGNDAGKVVESVEKVIDKSTYTQQERSQDDQKDLESARLSQAPSHDSWFDVLVDGIARLIRPGVTIWLIGGFVGIWKLPDPGATDPYWQNVFLLVITFWFGGRTILKDLPEAIRLMRK